MKHRHSGRSGSRSSNRWPLLLGGVASGFVLIRQMQARQGGCALREWALKKTGRGSQNYSASASFAINCTAEEAYRTWRDFEKISRFLRHVESVKVLDDKRSEWTIEGPMGRKLRWVAEIVDDRPGERIAWRSAENSAVETHGSIEFRPNTSGRGIVVSARVDYTPPAGAVTRGLFRVFGRDPGFTVREDLRRFKALLEAGEVPTVAGQTHGPRGVSGAIYARVLREPDTRVQPRPEGFAAEARIA